MKHRLVIGSAIALTGLLSLSACGGSKSSSADNGGGSSDAAYCAKVAEYKDKSDTFDSVLDEGNPSGMRTAFETMQGLVHDLDKNPPASIAADVHAVRKGIDEVVAVFAKYDYDFTKLMAAPEFAELAQTMEGDALTAATDRLDKWGVDVCGFPPDEASS